MTPLESFWRSAPFVARGESLVVILRGGFLTAMNGSERLRGVSLAGTRREAVAVRLEALGFALVTAYATVREFVAEETWIFQEMVVSLTSPVGLPEDLDTTEWTSPRVVEGLGVAVVYLPRT